MRRNRKVKILATLGPASSDEQMIQKLHEAGADLFRINMSHASHDVMRTLISRIRAVEARCGRPIGILADLQGPKLRVGKFANGSEELKPGQTFTLDNKDVPGDNSRVFLPHPEILESVKPGHRLLIDDGKLHLRAEKCDGKSIVCTVVSGTKISDRKGVSLPDTLLGVGALTEKDRVDLDAVLATGSVDWVALSFIQRPEDLAEVRKISRGRVGLMSKIEKPQAIERIDEIIDLSDALMVARGGRWTGDVKMCVAENEFKIVGVKDCFARGYQQMGFKEYDTGKQGSWMVQLTDTSGTQESQSK